MKSKIGVIGNGVVGSIVLRGFEERGMEIFVYDKLSEKSRNSLEELMRANFIFICVPTPTRENGIDLSALDDTFSVLEDYKGIIIIKSTVVPGTSEKYHKKYPQLKITNNPEFLRESSAYQDFINQDRIIIGSFLPQEGKQVAQLYRNAGFSCEIFETSPEVAEAIKFFTNTFLPTKVIFANEFKSYCDVKGINYEDVIKGVTLDKRIGSTHLQVTQEGGYSGMCFPKDVKNLIKDANDSGVKLHVLEQVDNVNEKIRKKR